MVNAFSRANKTDQNGKGVGKIPCFPVLEGRSLATVGKPRVSKEFWWLLDPKKHEETADGKRILPRE
jgi:hypothetical protein